MDSARKEVRASIRGARCQPILQRGAALFRDLELDRAAGLALHNCRPVSHMTGSGDVINSQADEIATGKLAVERRLRISKLPKALR